MEELQVRAKLSYKSRCSPLNSIPSSSPGHSASPVAHIAPIRLTNKSSKWPLSNEVKMKGLKVPEVQTHTDPSPDEGQPQRVTIRAFCFRAIQMSLLYCSDRS